MVPVKNCPLPLKLSITIMMSHPLRNLITCQQNGILTPVKLGWIHLAILHPMGPFLLKGNMFEHVCFSIEMRTSFFAFLAFRE